MLDGEEQLNSQIIRDSLSTDDLFNLVDNSINNTDNIERFQKSKESVSKELNELDDLFNEGIIPDYKEVNQASLHASYLVFISAYERAIENNTKNNLDAFGIAHKIFADERTKLQKSQEVEKTKFKSITNKINELLQKALENNIKLVEKVKDEYMYKDFWNTLHKDIISILKAEILNQKTD